MKIVINDCYGGFSISPIALEKYAERKGIEKLYWFTWWDSDTHERSEPRQVERPEVRSFPTVLAYTIDNPDEHTKSFSSRDFKRDDPDLVAVVEELGSTANGAYAELKVVEIPDDVDWCIEEYDGREWVAEKHRTWG